MASSQNTLWERFLAPIVFRLIDYQKWKSYGESIDWQKECDRINCNNLTIPHYYSSQNFHGIKGGYFNPGAAIYYDPITRYALPPHETWTRQALIDAIQVKPRRILDLGCGTGSTTLMLKQAFPEAEVIGLDLSPYMLVRAEDKAKSENLEINWLHGNAEKTGFADASFDLVTAALLFHETPVSVCQGILRESFRLLVEGGQMVILDGNQKRLRKLKWLHNIFEEPYISEYAESSLDAILNAVGFTGVGTNQVWWTSQVTSGIKVVKSEKDIQPNISDDVSSPTDTTIDHNEQEILGFPALS
jgi:ubiquinone/menaquinone biosynthesis C-methylase UbiE